MVPNEYEEQVVLRQYCEFKGLPFFAVPNETYTTSWNQKRRNRAKGVVSGVPDFWVIANGILIAIELKRIKGGVVSESQKRWLKLLNDAGTPAKVCKGAEEAIKFIESM
jgi:hypothetical protein